MTDSIRELIAELAQVEDAIRRVSHHAEAAAGTSAGTAATYGPAINAELVALTAKEEQILALLHGHETSGPPRPADAPVAGAAPAEPGP